MNIDTMYAAQKTIRDQANAEKDKAKAAALHFMADAMMDAAREYEKQCEE